MTIALAAPPAELPHPAPARPADPDRTKLQRFVNWLTENGASFPSVRLILDHGVREIYAKTPIQSGQLVMHIPRHLLITAAVARESRIGRLLTDDRLALSDHGFIAAFLLMTRRDGGFFKPYVDILPENVTHLPISQLNAPSAVLNGTSAGWLIDGSIAELRCEYRQLAHLLPPSLAFSETDYAWAISQVVSRAHGVFIDEKETTALVPLADMPNHAAQCNLRWTRSATIGFSFAATAQVDADTPLTASYGSTKDNRTLYAMYGFAIEMNPNDSTIMLFPAPARDHPAYAATEKMGLQQNEKRLFDPVARYSHDSTRTMFSFLRLMQRTTHKAGDDAAAPLSRDNELGVLATLGAACRSRLSEFSTTLEDDEKLLAAWDMPASLRYSVIVRHGELRVLGYLQNLAEAGTAFLNGVEPEDGFDGYIDSLRPLDTTPEKERTAAID